MPSLKVIRRRIASVKNTQKITRAMKMVAAARLNRAQLRIKALRPYAVKTAEVLRSLAGRAGGDEEGAHQLLAQRPVKRVLLLVLTSDRGLAGAFNSSIQRAAERKIAELRGEGLEVLVGAIGRKGRDYLKRRGLDARHDWSGMGEPTAELAAEIARTVSREFVEGEVDMVASAGYNPARLARGWSLDDIDIRPCTFSCHFADAEAYWQAFLDLAGGAAEAPKSYIARFRLEKKNPKAAEEKLERVMAMNKKVTEDLEAKMKSLESQKNLQIFMGSF